VRQSEKAEALLADGRGVYLVIVKQRRARRGETQSKAILVRASAGMGLLASAYALKPV